MTDGARSGQAPAAAYGSRLGRRRSALEAADRDHLRLALPRLAVAAALVVVAWGAIVAGRWSPWWLVVPAMALLVLGRRMRSLERNRERAGRALAYYESGLRRLAGDWEQGAPEGARFADPDHLFARDLDLFGPSSLFARLSLARTGIGEATLAGWLLRPATAAAVRERARAVAELAGRMDFREDVAVLGDDASGELHRDRLAAWATRPGDLPPDSFRRVARVLSGIGAAAILAFLAFLVGALDLVRLEPSTMTILRLTAMLSGGTVGAIGWRQRRRAEAVLHDAEAAGRELRLVRALLERCEAERFESARLRALRDAIRTDGVPASVRIARLVRLIDLVDARHGSFVRMFGPFVLWDLHLAWALEDWRRDAGAHVEGWLATLGELEALTSVATYRFEVPDHVEAEILDEGPRFEAVGLGHPLLPADRRVCNDVTVGVSPRLLMVSGSNMSGKSTLLRTVGVNAVLAQAGAPVCADRLRISSLAIGASIAVQDSLREGMSRFYTEITRLRAIVAVAESGPLLFLVDELLQGTNSHDRRIGAAAIVRGLLDRGAVGLLTTHDLALTEIAADPAANARNVHFADELRDGRLHFDFRMRDGVVARSNALELMRSVGLEV